MAASDAPAHLAMWFSLSMAASSSPMRWLMPPPQRTAYFSRCPGVVLRVFGQTQPGALELGQQSSAVAGNAEPHGQGSRQVLPGHQSRWLARYNSSSSRHLAGLNGVAIAAFHLVSSPFCSNRDLAHTGIQPKVAEF